MALSIPLCGFAAGVAQGPVQDPTVGSLNQPDRLEWFRDQGFGLFIHWSVDSQNGAVISHSLVDASPEYADSFFHTLQKTFKPERFDADALARLAKVSGVRYMMFTTKHHSGFAMWSTATTSFGVMHTPFHRDITRELFTAFRAQDIAPGVYFSPDDFWWLQVHNKPILRHVPQVQFAANPGLLHYDQQQLRELMTKYGRVDLVFLDGEPQGLRELAWKLQPRTLVTRGAIATPEQYIPGAPLDGGWEACITMGTAWQWQPQNETYKSGLELIRLLVQTRARGGNLLLNVGPKPNGELPIEQEERLREIGLWMMVNSESIYSVRPWTITNEGDVWLTRGRGTDTVYATVDRPWKRGDRTEVVLRSVRATPQTQVSVLGQASKAVEYRPDVDPTPTIEQKADGLHILAMRTQRLQDNSAWPNPAVIRLTHVESAFTPPTVTTLMPEHMPDGTYRFTGTWTQMTAEPVAVGFSYRRIDGEDKDARTGQWTDLLQVKQTVPGTFSEEIGLTVPGRYEVRATLKHPLITLSGQPVEFTVVR